MFITTSNYYNYFFFALKSRNHSLCYITDLFKVSRILQIFLVRYLRNSKSLVIYCVLWSYLHSKEIDENRNRIIRITGLTFSENIRHVNDPVGHQRRMRACSSQKYLTRNDTLINYLAMIKRWDINFSRVSIIGEYANWIFSEKAQRNLAKESKSFNFLIEVLFFVIVYRCKLIQ